MQGVHGLMWMYLDVLDQRTDPSKKIRVQTEFCQIAFLEGKKPNWMGDYALLAKNLMGGGTKTF